VQALRVRLISILILFLFVFEANPAEGRPKVGLALSGGGARGIAHIGILKALERMHVPVDFIAGTSIGAYIGALYAAGYTANEIERIFSETNWDEVIFNDHAPRVELPLRRKIDHGRYLFDFEMGYRSGRFLLPSGLVHGQRFSLLLQDQFLRVAPIKNFSRLPIPFKAVAGNAVTGEMVVLDHGNLADAVRASTAYPGLFSPVQMEGELLLDGGAVNNLPADIVKKMGADVVIAVDISSPLAEKESLASFVDFSDQFVTILMRRTVQRQKDFAKLILVPTLNDETTFSYKSFDQVVKSGEDSVQSQASFFRRLEISPQAYKENAQRREQKHFEPKIIDELDVSGFDRVDKHTVQDRLGMRAGSSFDARELSSELESIYSQGDFERVDYAFSQDSGRNKLLIRAIEKRWGPNYAHFGVTWDGEIKGKRDGNALLNLQLTRLNRLNAEWTIDTQVGSTLAFGTEFYQPLDYWGVTFVAPRFSAVRMYQDFYANEKRVAEYEIDSVGGEIDLGVDCGKYGEIRGGVRQGFLNSESELASSAIPSFKVQTGAFVGRLRLDQLDSAYFPRRGIYLGLDYLSSQKYLGADYAYRKMYGDAHLFYSLDRFTFFLSGSGGGNLGSTIPLYDEFLLGGFRSLSGFRIEELRGQQVAVARAGSMVLLPIPATVLWKRIFLAAWAEGGNTWTTVDQMSFASLKYAGTFSFGLDTKLGPIFLGYGQSGADHQQFYISVGRTFGIQSPRVF
jgi:NTE family protein